MVVLLGFEKLKMSDERLKSFPLSGFLNSLRNSALLGYFLIFSALKNFFYRTLRPLPLLKEETFVGRPLLRIAYCLIEFGSLSEVAEPLALAKSRQNAFLSNLSGKLNFGIGPVAAERGYLSSSLDLGLLVREIVLVLLRS